MPLVIKIANTISSSRRVGGGGYCPEAIAYFAATGITDPVRMGAYNTLFLTALADGWWTKMISWNGMCNGSAAANKYNIVNPVDTDPAHRLTFGGGWTYGAYGSTPNGINAYCRTYLVPDSTFIAPSYGLSFFMYSRTNSLSGGVPVYGCTNYGVTPPRFMQHSFLAPTDNMFAGESPNSVIFTNLTNSNGLFTFNRKLDGNSEVFQNNTSRGTNFDTFILLPNYEFYWGARNSQGGIDFYDYHEVLMCGIGYELSDAEALSQRNAIQAFAVAIGGNV